MRTKKLSWGALCSAVLLFGGWGSGCGDDAGSGNDNETTNNNNVADVLCGNGEVEGLEECDEGEDNSDTVADACRTDCTLARCGDGHKSKP